MASRNKKYYLGKSRKIYGPFNDQEFDLMVKNGDVHQYHWIWDEGQDDWKPIEPPPPMKPSQMMDESKSIESIPTDGVPVILHNKVHMVSGVIAQMTETSCQILIPNQMAGIKFPINSEIFINLMNSETQHSMNVRARLVRVRKENSGWVYALRWNGCPEVIAA